MKIGKVHRSRSIIRIKFGTSRKACYYITITSHPAIPVPAGFTSDSPALPVGLQIVGRYRDDFGVLQLAHAFEQQTKVWQQRPALAR